MSQVFILIDIDIEGDSSYRGLFMCLHRLWIMFREFSPSSGSALRKVAVLVSVSNLML